ncbi:hypothetical protein BST27_15260 [Mycobacterium intermedium]|uniref:Uncharacterized protein n=1 Tax=Mycobacterium intermedium TaxID=28445 RepID=A0A1E3S8L7_MYCIE|nr:hypothetical protein [Mycobacterium intermedium]MCV6967681.1 hypothetical protein [Mycobacterium intermedium]ODQ98496.1 hypothetical protein BHQ20_21605 [Mycobacterium intermedium]OPE48083.1 hypothetical protein BV508_19450 [Mycobacterium intermedium]ORB03506.1 hypothetical protein BST27_15260 [Mycobacterium intermedium]
MSLLGGPNSQQRAGRGRSILVDHHNDGREILVVTGWQRRTTSGAAIDDDPEIVELWHEFGIPVTTVFDCGALLQPNAERYRTRI